MPEGAPPPGPSTEAAQPGADPAAGLAGTAALQAFTGSGDQVVNVTGVEQFADETVTVFDAPADNPITLVAIDNFGPDWLIVGFDKPPTTFFDVLDQLVIPQGSSLVEQCKPTSRLYVKAAPTPSFDGGGQFNIGLYSGALATGPHGLNAIPSF